jgi:hypothetical protein
MASEKFPEAYRNSVPQDLDNPDSMVKRVPVTHTEVGARKSVLGSIRYDNNMAIRHTPDQNGH